MRIAVVGGTGTVGRHVVDAARDRDHEVVVVARSQGVDVCSRAALDRALHGVDVVVDVGNVASVRRQVALDYFERATATLQGAAAAAGVAHLVVLSIVGIDRLPGVGYYAAKRRQEEVATAGPVPVTVLRATQFHEFAGQLLGRGRQGPVVVVPRMTCQPVAAASVAQSLVDHAEGPPRGRAPDLAGPRVETVAHMTRRLLAHRGQRLAVVAVGMPGSRATAEGALLPRSGATLAGPTFDRWLAAGERLP